MNNVIQQLAEECSGLLDDLDEAKQKIEDMQERLDEANNKVDALTDRLEDITDSYQTYVTVNNIQRGIKK